MIRYSTIYDWSAKKLILPSMMNVWSVQVKVMMNIIEREKN